MTTRAKPVMTDDILTKLARLAAALGLTEAEALELALDEANDKYSER